MLLKGSSSTMRDFLRHSRELMCGVVVNGWAVGGHPPTLVRDGGRPARQAGTLPKL